MKVDYPIISADSHITEPPEHLHRLHRPGVARPGAHARRRREQLGDVFVIDGLKVPIPMGLVAAAGKDPAEIRTEGAQLRGAAPRRLGSRRAAGRPGPRRRRRRDHLSDRRHDALQPLATSTTRRPASTPTTAGSPSTAAHAPDRLLGCGQTAMRTPEEGIEDLKKIKALGPARRDDAGQSGGRGLRLARSTTRSGRPPIELGLPLSFHILTTRRASKTRGPKINSFLSIIRGCQDIMGMLVFGGVFERHPELKVVCVEADAGWVPHFMYRMDHAYKRHRYWLKPGAELAELPSEYFAEHIYMTFQDDWVAFRFADQMNWRRLMWANDFPHSDSTWPWSQEMLAEHTADLTDEQTRAILCDNVAELYGIDRSSLPTTA